MLYNANGTTPAAVGMLVQLIVSTTDNVFSPPTPGSFTGTSADDIVLASFTINAGAGSFAQPLIITLSGNIAAGEQILLRWFPTLSGSTPPSAPPAGTPYGQFRTNITESFSDSGWFLPADGSTIALNFLTTSAGGAEPESAGAANLTVVAIPEPTSLAFLGVGLIGAACIRRRVKTA